MIGESSMRIKKMTALQKLHILNKKGQVLVAGGGGGGGGLGPAGGGAPRGGGGGGGGGGGAGQPGSQFFLNEFFENPQMWLMGRVP
jgi:hypothetical protein